MTMADEGKTIINVTVQAGAEYVQEKHVQYEIGKVETGGIGVQVIEGSSSLNGSSQSPGASGAKVQGGGKPSPFRVVSNVFTYKWAKKHPERIVSFYQYLVKFRAIDQDTNLEEFEKLFTGVPTDLMIKWLAPKSALNLLMTTMKKRELILPAGRIWLITESHFKDKDNQLFQRLRNEKPSDRLACVIDRIVGTLDPNIKVQPLSMLDEDQADELWSGIRDKGFDL